MRTAKGRQRLARLLRRHPELISVEDAATALDLSAKDAAKLLSRWVTQGWLKRVRRGLYAPIPLTAETSEQVLADPWILVPRLFDPAYIGGWSAAEHWDLTEQIFRSLCIFTGKPVRKADVVIQNIPFHLKHVPDKARYGTSVVWRENVKVHVSDPTKTIIDMLDDPSIGGGIRHVASCLTNYMRSEHIDRGLLLEYSARRKNGAIFKRLGFLAERLNASDPLVETLTQQPLTKGNAKLDPAVPVDKLMTRWKLWVPLSWATNS